MIKPAIFEAVKGVEQRHVQETDQLTNSINGEETHNPSLNEEEGLEQKIEEHVCNDLADAGKRLSFTSRHFKRQISNVLEPNGIDYLAKHKERQNPESTEYRCQDEFQPGPHVTMQRRVTNDSSSEGLQQWDKHPIKQEQA